MQSAVCSMQHAVKHTFTKGCFTGGETQGFGGHTDRTVVFQFLFLSTFNQFSTHYTQPTPDHHHHQSRYQSPLPLHHCHCHHYRYRFARCRHCHAAISLAAAAVGVSHTALDVFHVTRSESDADTVDLRFTACTRRNPNMKRTNQHRMAVPSRVAIYIDR